MDGVKKKQGAHPLVQALAGAAEPLQVVAFPQQLLQRGLAAKGVQRLIARGRLRRGDDLAQQRGHIITLGNSSYS